MANQADEIRARLEKLAQARTGNQPVPLLQQKIYTQGSISEHDTDSFIPDKESELTQKDAEELKRKGWSVATLWCGVITIIFVIHVFLLLNGIHAQKQKQW